MHNNISRISFSKLKKEEVRNLAGRVIVAVEAHDPETLQIKEIYDLLVELQPQIKALKLRHIAHPVSKKLDALRKQRIGYSQGIIKQIETIERTQPKEMQEPLELAKPILLHHLKGLWGENDVKVYENIEILSDMIKENVELSSAVSSLNLDSYISNLLTVNSTIGEYLNERTQDISERPKNPTPAIVAAVKTALEDLFKQIEVAQVKNKELVYKPLIDRLNGVIAYFKAELKARSTYNKKKAEEALNNKNTEVVEKQDEVIVEPASEEPSTSTQSTERMYPTNVEVDNEENLEQLDIKKTAAVSTKQTRLPIVSPEA